MASTRRRCRRGWLTALHGSLAAAALLAAGPAARAADRGYPVIRVVNPPPAQAVAQTFGITVDRRGVLYLATLGGVVTYDGAWWTRTPTANGSAAWAVAVDAEGRPAAGAVDELGWLDADAHGTPLYRSLLTRLPPGERDLAEVAGVHPLPGGGFVFRSDRRLVRWLEPRVESLAVLTPGSTSFAVDGTVLVWQRERGLERLAGSRLEAVSGGAALVGRPVDLALAGADGALLLALAGEGLFLLADGELRAFAPEASRWAQASRVTAGCRLRDGRWALGSHRGGLLLLRPDGTVEQIVDQASGLPEDFVAGVVESPDGELWLAFDRGELALLEVSLPVTVLDSRAGLRGSVNDVADHQGELWVATSAGLFTTRGAGGQAHERTRLRTIPGVPATAWSLLPDGESLLVGTSSGVHQVIGEDTVAVPGSEGVVAYSLTASRDRHRVWVGEREGLGVLRREARGWRHSGRVSGVARYARSAVERPSVLWVATTFEGIFRLALDAAGTPGRPRLTVPPDDREFELSEVAGLIVASDGERLRRLDERTGGLVEDARLQPLAEHGLALDLVEDALGNLWLGTTPPVVALRRDDGFDGVARPLAAVPLRRVVSLGTTADGAVWIGSADGLVRWQGPVVTAAPPPAPRVARVLGGPGEILFGGAPWLRPGRYVVAADSRRLRIELAPGDAHPTLGFQSWLEPRDDGWSEPAAEAFLELGQLRAGSYRLRVRSLGADRMPGPEATLELAVLAPWYLTGPATAVWALLVSLVLIGYPRLRLRAIRARARDLEQQVAAHTMALRRTVDELQGAQAQVEEKNSLLVAANQRLDAQSRHDALTGLANRRHFDEMLAGEWERARRQRVPVAVLLLDLDHFKQLNDAHGHLEGDACLRQVGAALRSRAQRPGDLAARYGGEELAILLPGTTLAGAEELGEQLRAAIQGLAIPHPAPPAGVVTASVGVAALVPGLEDGPEALVEAADAALYRAKSDGRNRVRVAGPAPAPPAAT